MDFDSLVKRTETCWIWTGSRNRDGYGMFRNQLAHRIVYITENGDYPPGTVTDHLCRVRHCVNPQHLEAVSRGENVRRGHLAMLMVAKHARVVQCPQGHGYSQENLYRDFNKDGYTRRKCKTCTKERRRLQYLREKESRRT